MRSERDAQRIVDFCLAQIAVPAYFDIDEANRVLAKMVSRRR